MNLRTKTTTVWLAALLVGVSLAFGGGAGEQPAGEPPFGVAVQSDAQGSKLMGVGSLEFYNINIAELPAALPADVRAFVRLRHGTKLDTVFAEVAGVNLLQIGATQAAIVAELKAEILEKFFNNDQSLQVTVKGLDEFIPRETFNSFVGAAGEATQMVLFDVVFAVK